MENIADKALKYSLFKNAEREEKKKSNFNVLGLFQPKNKGTKYAKIDGKIQHQPNWMYRNE